MRKQNSVNKKSDLNGYSCSRSEVNMQKMGPRVLSGTKICLGIDRS